MQNSAQVPGRLQGRRGEGRGEVQGQDREAGGVSRPRGYGAVQGRVALEDAGKCWWGATRSSWEWCVADLKTMLDRAAGEVPRVCTADRFSAPQRN